jgi:hypothetical protein
LVRSPILDDALFDAERDVERLAGMEAIALDDFAGSEVLARDGLDTRFVDVVVEDGSRVDVDRRTILAAVSATGAHHLDRGVESQLPDRLLELA